MRQFCWMLALTALWTGCHSTKGRNESYLAPAVNGRVVEAKSGEPLQNAYLKRYLGKPTKIDPLAEKGAQRLKTVRRVDSDDQGRFSIPPEKGRFLFAEAPPVFDITLVVRHDNYQTLTTNIDLLKIKPFKTNNVLTINVGDLPLEPKPD